MLEATSLLMSVCHSPNLPNCRKHTGCDSLQPWSETPIPLTTAASWPVRLRLGFIDGQRPSAQFSSVQSCDCFVGFTRVCHFHKSKAARPAGVPVGYYAYLVHGPMGFENGAQLSLSRAVR